MELIDKTALVAEIEKELNTAKKYSTEYVNGKKYALNNILSFIDTLEVKEVELEKEIKLWFDYGLPNNDELLDYIKETAKHFFELGFKAQKGEEE